MSDPNYYLNIAGGCAVAVGCLVCCAINWDNPPDWCPNWLQPEWKRYDVDETHKKRNSDGDINNVTVAVKDYNSNSTKDWELV
tara:strand:+ start:322 stop:570 length:249 start_codon:yes stop_codon:yes gene_type:complete